MRATPIATFVALLLLSSPVFAHGGSWRGPGWPPPSQGVPTDPGAPRTPTLPGDPGTPTPPPLPGNPGVPTNPGGPTLPGAPVPPRRTPSAGPDLSHWTVWWSLNRERLLDLRALQTERLRARTNAAGPFFFGDGRDEAPEEGASDEARRAILDALLAAAGEKNADVASGAVVALGKAGAERVLPRLKELVDDERADATVNESAALAMGMVGGGAETRTFLIDVMTDGRRRTRTRAFAALGLGFLGDPGAIPALVSQSRQKEAQRDVPSCALLALGLLGEEMLVPDLGQGLSGRPGRREADDLLRAYHAAALAGIRSAEAIPSLLTALRDGDENVRRQAVLALASVAGPEDEEVVKILLYVLGSDRDSQTQCFAAVALGEIGSPLAADALLYAFRKGESAIVPYAALGMGLLARNAADTAVSERIVPFLRAQLAERANHDLQGALAVSLGIARDAAAARPLTKMLDDEGDPELRAHLAIALGLIGDREAAPALRRALEDRSSPSLQREAALALGLLADSEAVEILTKLVREGTTEYVRGSAATALGRLASPEAAEALREILVDQDAPDTTRAFVAVALGLVLDRHPVPILSRLGDHLNQRMATAAVAEVLTLL